MTKQLLSLLFFLLVSLGTTFAQSRTFDLADQQLDDIPRSFYIAEVIDARVVKTSIGTVQLGMLNRKVPAQFTNPLEQELLAFINRSLPQQEGQTPLVLRINKFWVSEETRLNAEIGSAEMLVDFLLPEGGTYRRLYTAAAVASQQSIIDVTKGHEENMAKAIADCLKQLAARSITELLPQAQTLTAEKAYATFDKVVSVPDFPILQASAYPEGVYSTLDEFRTNNPSAVPGFEVKGRSGFQQAMVGGGDIMPYQTTAEGKQKPIKDAWGFSDGHTPYIRYQDSYYPLAVKQNDFVFIGPPTNTASVTGAGMAGALVGGAIGAGIAGGIAAATLKPDEYTLDLMTGHLMVDGRVIGINPASAKLIIYREAKSELPQPISLTVNGEAQALGLNETLEYNLPNTHEGASICISGDDNTCLSFMPEPGNTYYLACRLNKKSAGKPTIERVDEPTGIYEVKGIKFAKKKDSKRNKK